jgi:hypothetical protein
MPVNRGLSPIYCHSHDTIAITKNGVPEAVMLSMKKFEGLLETIDLLADLHPRFTLNKTIYTKLFTGSLPG